MGNTNKKTIKTAYKANSVYFDCNATTPVLPGVAKTISNVMTAHYANPSSAHSFGLQSKQTIDFSRQMAATIVGAEPNQIIFTSGATEAIQTSILSVLKALKNTKKTTLLYAATEHKAIPEALSHWVNILGLSYEIIALPVDDNGQIIMETLMSELPHAALLCTMAVNNETGVIQNLAAIETALINTNSEAYWLVDCVQALGKINLNLNATRIDYAVFSGHKIYAPKGIGFLYRKENTPFTPLIVGGGQEKNYRSGTENLSGIAGFGYILEQLSIKDNHAAFQSHQRLCYFRDLLITVLKEIFPRIIFNTPIEQSIPTTLNFSIPGISCQELLDVFDAVGLCLSGGSACNASSLTSSHVLAAMGKSTTVCASATRLSFGIATTIDEIELGCTLLRACAEALNQACLLENQALIKPSADLFNGVLQFNTGATNSWMIIDKATRSCIIIDPHQEVGVRIEQYVKYKNLSVLAVLDTHGHADHESIRPLLQKNLAPYLAHNNIDHAHFSPLGWPEQASFQCMITLDNQEKVPALFINKTSEHPVVLAQVHTPGHTDDSQTFLLGHIKSGHMSKTDVSFVFSGDMILGGGLGRTNFETSSSHALYDSLKKLESIITHESLICPSHDYNQSFCTSLKHECQTNALMALALDSNTEAHRVTFIAKKIEVDCELAKLEENFKGLICGTTNTTRFAHELDMLIASDEIKSFLHHQTRKPLIIDVSEQQAFALHKDWHAVALEETAINIPLARLVNFIKEYLDSKYTNHTILVICRTGERSLQAVKTLRRFGFNAAWSLDAGMALAKFQLPHYQTEAH
jgi:cysteine desulfurase